ncbi:MAG: cysteine desulfurase [Deltaproteobacteria bacterium]|nr:cysteine desulfurase [Deltaproteobacteria bacterium]
MSVKNNLERFIHGYQSNASSIHWHGRESKRILASSREAIASSLNIADQSEQLCFTSSGTESNQLAIRSVLEPLCLAGKNPHWITTTVEHDSVLQMTKWCQGKGIQVSFLPVDKNGIPVISALDELIKQETVLLSTLWVNNETGVITPLEKVKPYLSGKNISWHVDAVQAWGKIKTNINELGADFVTFSSHKIGGLMGNGILWHDAIISPLILGYQEKGRRGGTENLLGIYAAGLAAQDINLTDFTAKVLPLRERLQSEICKKIPGVIINGEGVARIANTLNISFDNIDSESLVMALDLEGFSLSAGSACSSGTLKPSHVLLAMGRSKAHALASLRVSLSCSNTWNELEKFINILELVVKRIRELKEEKSDPE